MERINVYDFDKTILPYDSTEAFFLFCLRRHPRALFPAMRALPYLALMHCAWRARRGRRRCSTPSSRSCRTWTRRWRPSGRGIWGT